MKNYGISYASSNQLSMFQHIHADHMDQIPAVHYINSKHKLIIQIGVSIKQQSSWLNSPHIKLLGRIKHHIMSQFVSHF